MVGDRVTHLPTQPPISDPGNRDLLAETARYNLSDQTVEPLTLVGGGLIAGVAPARGK